jgi:hypothetical protein
MGVKELLSGISILLVLAGCSTYKRVAKHPDKFCHICPTKEVVHDSIITEYRDSVIEIYVPADTLIITDFDAYFSLADISFEDKPIKRVIESDRVRVESVGDTLKVICKEDSLSHVIKKQKAVIKHLANTQKIIRVKERYTPDIVWFGGGFLLLLFFIIGFMIGRKFG